MPDRSAWKPRRKSTLGDFELFLAIRDRGFLCLERLKSLASVFLPSRDPFAVHILAHPDRSGGIVDGPAPRPGFPLPLTENADLLVTPFQRPSQRRSDATIGKSKIFRVLFAVTDDPNRPSRLVAGNVLMFCHGPILTRNDSLENMVFPHTIDGGKHELIRPS